MITNPNPVAFAIQETVRHAESLPFRDCIKYLDGFLILAHDAPEVAEIRKNVARLKDCDHQLELIAKGELPLPSQSNK